MDALFSLAQLKKLNESIKRRQDIAKIYDKELANLSLINLPKKNATENHIYNLYIIKIGKNRDGFAKALQEKGISVKLHYIPLHLLKYYKVKYELKVTDFLNALNNYQQILSIPIYEALSDDEVYYICESIKEISASY
jgi:dTDP-4-amino-4,6-dideoxygalactose transaminase